VVLHLSTLSIFFGGATDLSSCFLMHLSSEEEDWTAHVVQVYKCIYICMYMYMYMYMYMCNILHKHMHVYMCPHACLLRRMIVLSTHVV
jgi:hypothetical protein